MDIVNFIPHLKKGQVADVSAIFIWTAEPAEDLSGSTLWEFNGI